MQSLPGSSVTRLNAAVVTALARQKIPAVGLPPFPQWRLRDGVPSRSAMQQVGHDRISSLSDPVHFDLIPFRPRPFRSNPFQIPSISISSLSGPVHFDPIPFRPRPFRSNPFQIPSSSIQSLSGPVHFDPIPFRSRPFRATHRIRLASIHPAVWPCPSS
jgi:hypothetical protein